MRRHRARQPDDRSCLVMVHETAVAVHVGVKDRRELAIERLRSRDDHGSSAPCSQSQDKLRGRCNISRKSVGLQQGKISTLRLWLEGFSRARNEV